MTRTAVPFRSVPADAAVAIALSEADRLGARLRTEQIGPAGYPTTRSRLVRDGAELAVGCGKGLGAQALASAHFEALERYLMSAVDNRRLGAAPRLLSAATVAAQPALGPDLVIQRWAAEFPDSTAACAAHEGAGPAVWYPIFLSDPRYFRQPLPGDSTRPYRSLLRYSSSLGTAAGVTAAEAVLHGLCELVEHDGLSHALLRWFVAEDPTVDLVDVDSLPGPVRDLHGGVARAVGAPVHLIDLTTDLEVPVYLAVAEVGDGRPAPVGAGAGPVAGYAAERALTELVQTHALAARTGDAGHHAVRRLAGWPALQRCALLPVHRLLARGVRRVALRTDPGDDQRPEPALDRVGRQLRGHGIDYHVCQLAPPGSLIAVATTIAPGLERFSLVRLGVPVVPTGRGRRIWAARSGAGGP